MLAGVVEVVAVIGSVALLLAVHVAVHAAAADGALEQPGQDVLVVEAVCLELALGWSAGAASAQAASPPRR